MTVIGAEAEAGRRIEVRGASADLYDRFAGARRRQLIGVEDDMWAAFADQAEHHALRVDGHAVGCCAIDEEGRLLLFHVDDEWDELAADLLHHVVEDQHVVAAVASTVDPAFLSLALTTGGSADPVALMYEHGGLQPQEPEAGDHLELRRATLHDHAGAVAFCEESTEAGGAFLDRFLAERIRLGELYLVEDAKGWIAATGECRADPHSVSHAHVGLIVGTELRGEGLGSRLMRALSRVALEGGLSPLCSTEPTNLAAQQVIRRAGFRSRHRVFCIPVV